MRKSRAMPKERTYTVITGEVMLWRTMTVPELQDVLNQGVLPDGVELMRHNRRQITYVVAGNKLKTWRGRTVVDGDDLIRKEAIIEETERIIDSTTNQS